MFMVIRVVILLLFNFKFQKYQVLEDVIEWVNDMANRIGDMQPDRVREIHFPMRSRLLLYDMMGRTNEESAITASGRCPSRATFYRALRSRKCRHLKFLAHSRFAKCDMCAFVRWQLRICGIGKSKTASQLKVLFAEHNLLQMSVRGLTAKIELYARKNCGVLYRLEDKSDKTWSILPHLAQPPKALSALTASLPEVHKMWAD